MLIRDVIRENYSGELQNAVKRLLVVMMTKDVSEMPTEKFKKMLSHQGYIVSTEELVSAVEASGFANSVDNNTIVPKDSMPPGQEPLPTVDVGAMATDQALSDINSELPQ